MVLPSAAAARSRPVPLVLDVAARVPPKVSRGPAWLGARAGAVEDVVHKSSERARVHHGRPEWGRCAGGSGGGEHRCADLVGVGAEGLNEAGGPGRGFQDGEP